MLLTKLPLRRIFSFISLFLILTGLDTGLDTGLPINAIKTPNLMRLARRFVWFEENFWKTSLDSKDKGN